MASKLVWLLFSFRGRLGRRSYIPLAAAMVGIGVGLDRVNPLANPWLAPGGEPTMAAILAMLGVGSVSLVFVFVKAAIDAKRLHDFGLSGWWQLAPIALSAPTAAAFILSPPFHESYTSDIAAFGGLSLAAVAEVYQQALYYGVLCLIPGDKAANAQGPASPPPRRDAPDGVGFGCPTATRPA